MDDRPLTGLLTRLLERADFPGQGRIGSEELPDWPEEAHQALVDLRLLSRASNERGLVCDECEERCWLEPTRTTDAKGQDVLIHACLQGRDVGLLTFPPSRLVSWRLDLEGLAAVVGSAVGADGDPQEVQPGWAWELGRAEIAGRTRRVYLAAGLRGPGREPRWAALRRRLPPEDVLVFVPARGPDVAAAGDASMVPLAGLVELDEEGLRISPDRLARALGGPRGVLLARAEPETAIRHRAAPSSRWNQVRLRLADGDTVRVEVPGRPPRSYTAAEMGLAHKRSKTREQTKGWLILKKLCEGHGSCSWHSARCASFDAFKVQVSGLGKKLERFMGIEGSPFFPLPKNDDLRSRFVADELSDPPPYVGEDHWADR